MLKLILVFLIFTIVIGLGIKLFQILSKPQRKKFLMWLLYWGTMAIMAVSALSIIAGLF